MLPSRILLRVCIEILVGLWTHAGSLYAPCCVKFTVLAVLQCAPRFFWRVKIERLFFLLQGFLELQQGSTPPVLLSVPPSDAV